MFGSIVVGTDGSETAGEAVRQATDLAKAVGAAVHVVSAFEPVGNQRLREERTQVPDDMQWMVNERRANRGGGRAGRDLRAPGRSSRRNP